MQGISHKPSRRLSRAVGRSNEQMFKRRDVKRKGGWGGILLFMSDADVIQSEAGRSREGKQVKGTCCIGPGGPRLSPLRAST